MKILVVHSFEIDRVPPIKNLIEVLLRNGHQVTLIAYGQAKSLNQGHPNLKCILLSGESNVNTFSKLMRFIPKRISFRSLVEREMRTHDLIWTTWDSAVPMIGKSLFRYKHIMQIMELTEYIPAFANQKLFKINAPQYARHAYKVVVPEYNRAHIQKAWWDLERVPIVLPNKPANSEIDRTHIPKDVWNVIQGLDQERRKIILYQGVFYEDRDLNKFADVIDELDDKYCLYLMGRETDSLKQLLKKYHNIKYIPFITPPYHLLVTERAYIGLLPYKTTKSLRYSVLNALYCAPNKIYEYAQYGVPMLGTDVPGLKIPFSQFEIGYICETQSKEEIKENIRKIENHYGEMQENCKRFYDSINLDEIVEKILYEES